MRTLVIGRGAESVGSGVWMGVIRPLADLGHDVLGLDVSDQREVAAATRELTGTAERLQPELVVVVPTPGDLPSAGLTEIFSDALTVAVHAATAWDGSPTRLADVPAHVAGFDLVTVPDEFALERWRRYGPASIFKLGVGTDLATLDEASRHRRRVASVAVMGAADPANAAIVEGLVEAGIDFVLLGEGWGGRPDLRVYAADTANRADVIGVLAAADLAVELPPTEAARSVAGLSLEECPLGSQALDAAALGVPVLTVDRPGVEQVLAPGIEVLTFPAGGDAGRLVALLLATPDELAEVGAAGQERVRRDHRSGERWASLLRCFENVPGEVLSTRPGRAATASPAAGTVFGVEDLVAGRCAITVLRPDVLRAEDRHGAAAAAFLDLASEVGRGRSGLRDSLIDLAMDHLDDPDRETLYALRQGDGAGIRALAHRLRAPVVSETAPLSSSVSSPG
jgi:Glycosyl transferases group 1